MSLLGNLPHRCTAYSRARTRDSLGGSKDSFQVVFSNRSCWIQQASNREIIEFGKRGISVTAKVYFSSDPQLDENHIVTIGGKTYDVMSYSDPDASAGLGILFKIFVNLTTTGSTATV